MIQNRFRRWSLISVGAIITICLGLYLKSVHVDCRFEIVDAGRFYKSGYMPLNTLRRVVEKHGIKTVIDLRNPGTGDALCPEEWQEIEAERDVLKQSDVIHAHIPSRQVPEPETLAAFFLVMDNPESYPVLLHCYHGTGRAELFTALYRIEYLNWQIEKAISATRLIVSGSSFAPDKPKGRFLRNYQPRSLAL